MPRCMWDLVSNLQQEHQCIYICTYGVSKYGYSLVTFAARLSNYFVSGPIVTVRCIASWGQGTGTDRWAIRIGSFHARQPREAAKHPCSRSSGVTFVR